MKKTDISTLTILALLTFSLLCLAVNPVRGQNGPRSDLDILWYTSSDDTYTALVNDEVDIVQWDLTKEQKEAVEQNPNIQIGSYVGTGITEFDLNNNETIMDYPTSTNPMHIEECRQAIAYLIDKDYIVTDILEGFGARTDAPVSYPQTESWVDMDYVTYDLSHNGIIEPSERNYPYEYNVTAAVALLAGLGFNDTDGNGYLNYPNTPEVWGDAAGIDTTLMPLKIIIRTDTYRLQAGRYLYHQLEGDPSVQGDSVLAQSPVWAEYDRIGGDWDTTDEPPLHPPMDYYSQISRDHNYHIYTSSWGFGRFPTYLFFCFHSMFWYPYGPNYVTDYAHPDLDPILEEVYYAQDLAQSQNASKWYTREHLLRCINIPLWGYRHFTGWRKELAGVVNRIGWGELNDYTLLNAYRTDNPSAPLRVAGVAPWNSLNILYSQWYYEYTFLDCVYTGGITINPYDLSLDQPWVFQDWETDTWVDPRDGLEKTVVTYWLRKDVGCAAPATGVYVDDFDARDYEFTCWYNYAFSGSWQWSSFMDIHHTEIADNNTVKVYFDAHGMWFIYAPTYPLLGPSETLTNLLCEETCETFYGTNMTEVAPGCFEYQFTEDDVVRVINATVNDAPIYEGADFYIRAGYDTWCHNVFVNLTSFAPTDNITIYYTKPIPNGADGTYLGGNLGYDWTDTMYAYGPLYPISISAATASLKKNPYFFLETPPLGEVDWRWTYIGTIKPRSGYFKIDILDIVKCTNAYSSRGDGVYDPLYLPSADLDSDDLCHIGILDLVTITGKYAETFGSPP